MGWDLTVLNIREYPGKLEGLMYDSVIPLGSRDDVVSTIQNAFPEADISDPSWIVVTHLDYSLEFEVGDEEIVDYMSLHVHGNKESVVAISRLAWKSGWAFLDAAIGDFIDFGGGTQDEGFLRWQSYRDRSLED